MLSCGDALFGVRSCSTAHAFREGPNETASGTVTDLAGNTATATLTGINVDETPPTIAWGARTPTPNAAGWNNSDVSLPFSLSDALSGVAGSTPSSPLVLTQEGRNVTGT